MRPLVIKFHVMLQEGTNSSHKTLSNIHENLVISAEDREGLTDSELRKTIITRVDEYSQTLGNKLISEAKLDLSIDTADLEKEIEGKLKEAFPGVYISSYIIDSALKIYNISNITGKGWQGEDIVHPEDGMYLTTRHKDSFAKLKDGSWVNVYQGHDYYEGIVERVAPPLDEVKLVKFLDTLGIPYVIQTVNLIPVPPAREQRSENEESEYWS